MELHQPLPVKMNQDLNSGEEKIILKEHLGQASSICFTPDGTQLASGNKDALICIWDIKTGEQKTILQGHNDNFISLCFSLMVIGQHPLAKTLLSKYGILDLDDYVRQVCFSSNGAALPFYSEDESIHLWDIESGKEKKQQMDMMELFIHYASLQMASNQPLEVKINQSIYGMLNQEQKIKYQNIKRTQWISFILMIFY
ncbi:unnamed protein product [Paramecium pentaurelia]|uniref:Uncharacterized protein n=1 Tax=Paramecium pentaurelia TaxID=43138 RepID=A0A8S1YPD3_9CILI|nr:unnamed protein product [Paramecium pentaurelia]